MSTKPGDDQLFTFADIDDEELSFFLLDDLIYEHNERILTEKDRRPKRCLLSLRTPRFKGEETLIAPATQEELDEKKPLGQQNLWESLKEIAGSYLTVPGLVQNIPNMREGVRPKQVIKELGIKGKVVYSEWKGKIYVILKGNPRLRKILTGTRYGNLNPKIVKFGLSKVNFVTSLKGTATTALIFYGVA